MILDQVSELKKQIQESRLQSLRDRAYQDYIKQKDDPSTIRSTDSMLVLHKEEGNLLENILCDLLMDNEVRLSTKKKRMVLNVVKMLQEGK